MLDLEVSPEEGLQHDNWELILGMHFSQAVGIFQSQVRIIKNAHVIYNDQNPLAHDLILDAPGDGFRLIFDSKAQRLKLIEIYNMKLIRLKYCGTTFNGSETTPTVHQIDRCFGATRPGTFDKERGLFVLNFRGLSFYFPVDSQFQPHYSHGLGSLRWAPGEATPILSKLLIYQGTNGLVAEAPVPSLPGSCFRGSVYADRCQVLRNEEGSRTMGLVLGLYAAGADALEVEGAPVHFERRIVFGESAQSVVGKLGTPSKIYYKSDDKMKIHSKEAHKKVTSDKSDYFFNYFTLGIDILFDASSNRVIKFILHTNFPGHYDFTDYHRIPFSLTLGRKFSSQQLNPNPAEELNPIMEKSHIVAEEPPPPVVPSLPPQNAGGGGGGKGKKKKNGNGNKGKQQQQPQQLPLQQQPAPIAVVSSSSTSSSSSSLEKSSPPVSEGHTPTTSLEIGWDTRWEEVRNFLWIDKAERSKLEKPVVLTRSSASNPFGPSLCYGVQDMIFEVMSNDYLATVSLYYDSFEINEGPGA